MDKINVSMTINGKEIVLSTYPNRTLLEVLRDDLGLTGAKEGCGIGECGACSVIMDGRLVNSCLVLIGKADGSKIETIEGLGVDGHMSPIQEAFVKKGAVQCGYCTPGMIMAAKSLLDKNPDPTKEEIVEALSGNLCRCTGYVQIIEAVKEAASKKGAGR